MKRKPELLAVRMFPAGLSVRLPFTKPGELHSLLASVAEGLNFIWPGNLADGETSVISSVILGGAMADTLDL